MTHHINIFALLVVAAVLAVLLGGPVFLIAFGWRVARKGFLRGRVLCGLGMALLLAVLAPLACHLYLSAPWHTRMLARGFSPSGQE